MDNLIVTDSTERITKWALHFAPKFVLALLTLFIGLWIAKRLSRILIDILKRSSIDQEATGFINSIITIVLKMIVFLIAASVLGFQVSSILGILAGAVFAIGLALQGFLGNFASGITIIFFKPYRVGDWVQVSDTFGKVKSIQIFNTTMITPGDKTLIIPNGQVTENIITNFSTQGRMRLELTVTMPYAESFPKVKMTIQEALIDMELISQDPAPLIGIESFDSHNLVVSVRPYIHPDNYWEATYEALSRIKRAFSDANIQVAYSEGIELGSIGD